MRGANVLLNVGLHLAGRAGAKIALLNPISICFPAVYSWDTPLTRTLLTEQISSFVDREEQPR